MKKIVCYSLLILCISCCSTIYPHRNEAIISLKNNYWNTTNKQNAERMFFSTPDLSVTIGLPFTSDEDLEPYTYSMYLSIEPKPYKHIPNIGTVKHKVTSRYTFIPTDVYLIKNGKKQECKLHGLKIQKYALLSTTAEYPWVGSMDFLLPYAFNSLEGATIYIGGIEKDGKPIPPLEFTIHKAE